jgi:hypothetical protein
MKAIKLIISLFILSGSVLLAQVDDIFSRQERDESGYSSIDNILQLEKADIKSSVQFILYRDEFYPSEIIVRKINYNGEIFDDFDFERSAYSKNPGNPILRFRSFTVALPSDNKNEVQVTDFDVKEINNVNLAPIPFLGLIKPGDYSLENVKYFYIRGAKFSENKNMPENICSFKQECARAYNRKVRHLSISI